MRSLTLLTVAAGLLAAGAASAETVTGKIKYTGKPPGKVTIKPNKDPEVCAKKPLYDESLLVGAGGGLENAVVSIEAPPAGAPTPGKAEVDQLGCRFVPHVQAVTTGTALTVKSGDAVFHNVHAYQNGATKFNIALPVKGTKSRQKLDGPGRVVIKCDAGHTWMEAHVVVFEHAWFAVTGADGTFKIDGVPPGTHKVRVWHEKLGELEGSVEVKAGAPATVELALGPAK